MKLTNMFTLFAALMLSAPTLAEDSATDGDSSVVATPSREAGDVTEDCVSGRCINLTDGIYLLNFLYNGGPEPALVSCLVDGAASDAFVPAKTLLATTSYEAKLRGADVNGDGDINITDPIVLFNWLFIGGPPPEPIACVSVASSAV